MIDATQKLAVVAAAAALVTNPLAAQTVKPGQKEVLLQADHGWNGLSYTHYASGKPQHTMTKLTVAPHTALPWHTHPSRTRDTSCPAH